MVENSVCFPKAPLDERLVSSLFFPLQHLQTCLADVQDGVMFEGESLNNFRNSNRVCRNINIAVAAFSGLIGKRLLSTKTNRFRGRLLKAGGFLALGHSVHQTIGAVDKTLRQFKLDSNDRVGQKELV